MSDMKKISAVVIGATGAVGKQLMQQLLENTNYEKITTIGRRKLDLPDIADSNKLHQIVVDMANPEFDKELISDYDVAICTFGTTRKAAGSAVNKSSRTRPLVWLKPLNLIIIISGRF